MFSAPIAIDGEVVEARRLRVRGLAVILRPAKRGEGLLRGTRRVFRPGVLRRLRGQDDAARDSLDGLDRLRRLRSRFSIFFTRPTTSSISAHVTFDG
jgi:hypothetical protein